MKKFAVLLLFAAAVWSVCAAEPQVVCEDGICRIVPEEPAKNPAEEKKSADNVDTPGHADNAEAGEVVCEDGICRIVPGEPENETISAEKGDERSEKTVMSRKLLGFNEKDEFMAFLKGVKVEKSQAGFWGMLLIALLGGLALNLTPCVLPMLPINLAVIGASGGKKGFRQGLLYGCGMAAAYGILGVLAAFAGVSFGALNSSPFFNFGIALIFLIMSLAMAGVFNIDAASKFRVNPKKLPFSEGFTALFMGGVSALLAGACVAPVVISVLLFAAETVGQGNLYGALIPFVLGIGMALPWPLAGAGLSILPKPGKFMVALKYAFALLIFGMAVYYVIQGISLLPDAEKTVASDGFAALEKAEDEAVKSGRPILVKFTASWCKNCEEMDRKVLRDKEVAQFIRDKFILVTFPAENVNDPKIKAVLDKYELPGLPAFVILETPVPGKNR